MNDTSFFKKMLVRINEAKEYAFNAIKGTDNADCVVLGKYESGSHTSYDSVARDIDAKYFNLDNWNENSVVNILEKNTEN